MPPLFALLAFVQACGAAKPPLGLVEELVEGGFQFGMTVSKAKGADPGLTEVSSSGLPGTDTDWMTLENTKSKKFGMNGRSSYYFIDGVLESASFEFFPNENGNAIGTENATLDWMTEAKKRLPESFVSEPTPEGSDASSVSFFNDGETTVTIQASPITSSDPEISPKMSIVLQAWRNSGLEKMRAQMQPQW